MQELKALNVDGEKAVKICTSIWLLFFIASVIFSKNLIDSDKFHWIWISLSGFILGIFGILYVKKRNLRLIKASQQELIQDFE